MFIRVRRCYHRWRAYANTGMDRRHGNIGRKLDTGEMSVCIELLLAVVNLFRDDR